MDELLTHLTGGRHGDEESFDDDLPLRQGAGAGLQNPRFRVFGGGGASGRVSGKGSRFRNF